MVYERRTLYILLIFLLVTAGCLKTPVIDREKAGYLATIRFVENNPQDNAEYTVADTGGDAYVVYFNVTDPQGNYAGFVEYYVDKYNKDIYASARYATALAVSMHPDLKKLSERYPNAKTDPMLIKTEIDGVRRYVWETTVIAGGVRVAVFRFDAVNEELLSVSPITTKTLTFST